MTTAKHRRYPVAPLLHIFGELSSREIQERYGIHPTTVNRWRNQPTTQIIEWEADRFAVQLGRHPGELWEDWFNIDAPIQPWRRLKQRA